MLHTEEIDFVLHHVESTLTDEEDAKVADAMATFWMNFLRFRDPNGDPTESSPSSVWPKYTMKQDQVLAIRNADDLKVVQKLKFDECEFFMDFTKKSLEEDFN